MKVELEKKWKELEIIQAEVKADKQVKEELKEETILEMQTAKKNKKDVKRRLAEKIKQISLL